MADQNEGMTIYHPSKVRFKDPRASKIWNRIKNELFSKEKGSYNNVFIGNFGDFKVFAAKTKNKFIGLIKFKYLGPVKKLEISLMEKYLKSLRTATGESYLLQSVSFGDTEALSIISSPSLGGIQKDANPGYIYAAEFQVTESGDLTVLAFCKYGIKIVSDFCKEAKLDVYTW